MDSLVITALKCSEKGKWNPRPVTYDEVEDDLMELWHVLRERTWIKVGPDGEPMLDELTEQDMQRALDLWDSSGYIRTPVDQMRLLTALPLERKNPRTVHNRYNDKLEKTFRQAKADKRAGVEQRKPTKQEFHLDEARRKRDLLYPDGDWINADGRPTKADQVRDWRKEHPDGTKAACARDTGLSRPTIAKWWTC